jgi:CHASE1-domain containing sensor protein
VRAKEPKRARDGEASAREGRPAPRPSRLSSAVRRSVLERPAPVAVVLSLGVAITTVAFALTRARDREHQRLVFVEGSAELGARTRLALAPSMDVLASVADLFRATSEVTPEGFARFARSALVRHPSIAFVAWTPVVDEAQRGEHEATLRQRITPSFEIREPDGQGGLVRARDGRGRYYPWVLREPFSSEALGLDAGVDPARRASLEEAIARGEPSVTERAALPDEPQAAAALTLYAPIYRGGGVPSSPAERNARARGLAVVALRVSDVMQRALEGSRPPYVHVALVDHDARPEARVLFETRPGAASVTESAATQLTHTRLELGGRRLGLLVSADASQVPARRVGTTVLVAGLALSLLAALATGLAQGKRRLRRDERAAARLGPYTLLRRIGEGGMGTVYEARHELLRRPTAVKVLSKQASEEALRRFEREVQYTSRLTHPNTIAIYDFGRTDEGIVYYAMEYLDGVDLEVLVESLGPMPPARVVHVLTQVTGSLREAHGEGLAHRDVKPGNIVLCARGATFDFVKVLDFGLVRDTDPRALAASRPGEVVGTPAYMAPEAITNPSAVGPPADIYSLGCVAYFLLTGRDVWIGGSMKLGAARGAEPEPPSKHAPWPVPSELEALVLACLRVDPKARPTAEAVLGTLAELGTLGWTGRDARLFWEEHGDTLRAAARALREEKAKGPSAKMPELWLDALRRG